MMWEIAVIGILIVIICVSRGMIDSNKFVKDNSGLFKRIYAKTDVFQHKSLAKFY